MIGRVRMADIGRALRTAITTGKVKLGLVESKKAVRDGSAKLVVVAENCPDEEFKSGEISVKRIVYPGDNSALGAACGKPFAISSIVILDQGTSNILSLY